MDVQTISIALAGIGIFIAAINSIISSRKADQQRQTEIDTRQAELYMQIYNRFNTTELRKSLRDTLYHDYRDVDDILKKYGSWTKYAKSDEWIAATQVGSFFAGIGVFIEQGFLDAALIDDLMGEYVIDYWTVTEPFILNLRKTNPRQGDKIEYLYKMMKSRHETGYGWLTEDDTSSTS